MNNVWFWPIISALAGYALGNYIGSVNGYKARMRDEDERD